MSIDVQIILENRKFIMDQIESAIEKRDEEGNFRIPLLESPFFVYTRYTRNWYFKHFSAIAISAIVLA